LAGRCSVVGASGLSWRDGGGEIQAKVIRSAQSVENTNAPGGVIDFAAANFADWIFPQRADTTLNIALGANTESRGGSITSPNNLNVRGDERTRLDTRGRPLTLRSYNRLEKAQQAGISPDTENWEGWSAAYDLAQSSAPMQGTQPRQFVQIRANFQSTVEAGGRLNFVQFAVSRPPMASLVLAEIAPVLATTGVATEFTYMLLPRLEAEDLGFDTIEIDTPTQAQGIDAVRYSGEEVAFEVRRLDARGFEVGVPRIDQARDGELIEVVFRCEVFKFGTLFSGRVYDSTRPQEVRQVVTPGEVVELVEGNTLSVGLTNIAGQVIGALRLVPAAFTPNGDGVNDHAIFAFKVVRLDDDGPLEVAIYDLSGRLMRQLAEQRSKTTGQYEIAWDGADEQGVRVPPGVYCALLRVAVDAGGLSAERTEVLRTVRWPIEG